MSVPFSAGQCSLAHKCLCFPVLELLIVLPWANAIPEAALTARAVCCPGNGTPLWWCLFITPCYLLGCGF